MKEFQERLFWRRIFFSKFTFVFLTGILIFFVYSTAKVYWRSRETAKVNEMAQKEINDLKAKKAELEALVNRLQTKTGAEEEVRNKFMVQKPGEKAVMIIDEGEKQENLPANIPSGFFPNLPRFFRGIWQFIKNIF